ncbi:MAG: macro domain-containing protein [Chloroflexi bacterium]|nr:macro domain-containing protein [Chloroflexota bacterium]
MREVLFVHQLPSGQVIRVVKGDLTEERVDAIVNAANEHLAHGGGVAGAIVRKGGPEIQEESNRWVAQHGPVRTGTAAITGAGRLPARYIIHAVGPVWGTGDEKAKLASAVRSALQMAEDHRLASISMPGISSGIFGFPKDLCAEVMFDAVLEFLAEHPQTIREINFCNIDEQTAKVFAAEARKRFKGVE